MNPLKLLADKNKLAEGRELLQKAVKSITQFMKSANKSITDDELIQMTLIKKYYQQIFLY